MTLEQFELERLGGSVKSMGAIKFKFKSDQAIIDAFSVIILNHFYRHK